MSLVRRRGAVAAARTAVAGGPVTADIAATLPALTQAATGTVLVGGAVTADIAATLPALTQAASGSVPIIGDIAATLPALTQDADGTVEVSLGIVTTSTQEVTATADSVTVTAPTSIAVGNLLVAFVRLAQTDWSSDGDVIPPTGWTLLRVDSDIRSSMFRSHIGVFTKTAGSSEPADYTWDRQASGTWAVDVYNIEGHGGVDVHDGDGISGVTSLTLPSLTVTSNGSLLLAAWSAWRGSKLQKWDGVPAGMTEQWNVPATESNDVAAQTGSEAVNSGATGSRTADLTASSDCDRLCGSVVAIAPAP